ncbi:hypothetical protein EJ03DRAFT_336055 [Teratosphaeria nubilosa]|uniref:Uncharacterized protein n=1 Tax=Teratosphaeria nubilosa TaxID=161662 RepID=A0A6G1LA42_9PEZI|nr:hypothetical protein EJ03DRAFT_336055 [Teratosphaeria nubilosa]
MDDVRTTRDMEDFLINPTYPHVAMDGDPGRALIRPDSNVSTTSPPDRMYSWKVHHKNASLPVINALSHFSWQSYASEEELASPVDADDMSARSPSIASLPRRISSEESLPELLEKSCDDAEQQCNKAQAVRVVVAGKAKVVSMPRLVDDKKRPTAIMHIPPALRKGSTDASSQTSSLDSRRDSPRTSAEESPSSPASTTPSSVDADEPPPIQPKSILRRRPSLPQLNTSRTQPAPPMPSTAHVRQAVDYWERQPIQPVERRQSMPLSPGLRKLHKISSSLAMNIFKKDIRQISREDDIAEEPDEMPQPPILAPALAGRPRPKMIARGASERAPPLVLPPCPEDYDDNDITNRMVAFPRRKDLCPAATSIEHAIDRREPHRRQRSISLVIAAARA